MAWRWLILGERRRAGALLATALAAGSAGLLFVAAVLGIAFAPHADLPSMLLGGHATVGNIAARAVAPLEPRFIASRLGSRAGFPDGEPVVAGAERPARDDAFAEAAGRAVDHDLTNDALADAWSIPSVPFAARTQNTAATRRAEDPNDCSAVGGTAWYRYRADRDRRLVAYTFGSDHPTAVGVFEQTSLGLAVIGCDTDAIGSSIVTFTAESERSYLFQVAAPAGGGNLVFNLDPAGTMHRVTIGAGSEPPNEFIGFGSMSADGRYVAFTSSASNFVEGHGPEDEPCPARKTTPDARPWPTACAAVWLRDLESDTIELVSVANDGTPADAEARGPFASADGRYVLFHSVATNLAPGDTPGPDLFVRDRVARRTERIPTVRGVRLPEVDAAPLFGSISADGRYVAFQTRSALVDDDHNEVVDVYIYDRWTERHERVSVSSDGREAPPTDQSTSVPAGGGMSTAGYPDLSPYLSPNGRYVVFRSNAPNLVPDDRNGTWDFFVRDRLAGTTERVSVSSSGAEGNDASTYQHRVVPTISDDGRYVVFCSAASNLVAGDRNNAIDVFLRDRVGGTTTRVSEAWEAFGLEGHWLFSPSISASGRFIHLESTPALLALGGSDTAEKDSDVYRFDTATSTIAVVTVGPDGSDSYGELGQVSSDGRRVMFRSTASNLAGETNGIENIFVYEFPGIP